MKQLNIPKEIICEFKDNCIRFTFKNLSTDWMDKSDSFLKRIDETQLNEMHFEKHILKEMQIKNTLDRAIKYLEENKYDEAIKYFDEVLFYDSQYSKALFYKSKALCNQKHYIKALRYYKKAIMLDDSFNDSEFLNFLVENSKIEKDNFAEFKLHIYQADECFKKGEYLKALKSYDLALQNQSKINNKILYKLFNKKATALMKLNDYKNALKLFDKSLEIKKNNYSYFGKGYCLYKLDLNIVDEFKKPLKIDKKHLLKQASVLNELGFFDEVIVICDELFENHFKKDDFYNNLVKTKDYALKKSSENFVK